MFVFCQLPNGGKTLLKNMVTYKIEQNFLARAMRKLSGTLFSLATDPIAAESLLVTVLFFEVSVVSK